MAATVGILFWGWLWGVMGLVLAVPLTALVKLVADLHPSFMSLIQHAGADPASDSTLVAIRRDGFGTGDSLLARPSGKAPVVSPTPSVARPLRPAHDASTMG